MECHLFMIVFIGSTVCLSQECIGMFLLRTYCDLALRDTMCTVMLLRVLVDKLWQKAVMVLMTNDNSLTVCTAVKQDKKMATETRISNCGCPVSFFICFIDTS